MELKEIMTRFSEGLLYVDKNTFHLSSNQRTGEVYLPGVKTMTERKFVDEIRNWWLAEHPDDFNPQNAIATEVPYQNLPRANCDLQLSSDGSNMTAPEWAIEVKHIALVGNNGKNNDYGVAKILSPYLKDRSLIHDIERLKKYAPSKRKAVIGYCYSYSPETLESARKLHPEHQAFIQNIEKTCAANDPVNKIYSSMPLLEFANSIFTSKNLVYELEIVEFKNAWRHPCGGDGLIFGWEIKN